MAVVQPVITTNRASNGKLIRHGINGILLSELEYNEPDAYADNILRLLENPNKANALEAAWRNTIKEFFAFQLQSKEKRSIIE